MKCSKVCYSGTEVQQNHKSACACASSTSRARKIRFRVHGTRSTLLSRPPSPTPPPPPPLRCPRTQSSSECGAESKIAGQRAARRSQGKGSWMGVGGGGRNTCSMGRQRIRSSTPSHTLCVQGHFQIHTAKPSTRSTHGPKHAYPARICALKRCYGG